MCDLLCCLLLRRQRLLLNHNRLLPCLLLHTNRCEPLYHMMILPLRWLLRHNDFSLQLRNSFTGLSLLTLYLYPVIWRWNGPVWSVDYDLVTSSRTNSLLCLVTHVHYKLFPQYSRYNPILFQYGLFKVLNGHFVQVITLNQLPILLFELFYLLLHLSYLSLVACW